MNIEWDYLNEYKAAEKICREMGYENGVSGYIAEMEEKADHGRFFVSDWDDEYYILKHLRWLRNQIAHDSDKPYEVTAQDIEDIKRFHRALTTQQDPLTLLRIGLEKYRKAKRKSNSAAQPAPAANSSSSDFSNKLIIGFAIFIIISLIGIVIYSGLH